MNILLHICCAPCAIRPIEDLRKEGHVLAGYFYNPNIHPYSEYLKRKAEVEKLSKATGMNVIYGEWDLNNYLQHVVNNEAHEGRCSVCWWLRTLATAKFAKLNGFDAFTTTLLGSPYQDHDVLTSICEDVAKSCEIGFCASDLRPGFRDGQAQARAQGMYMQKYCGCLFSEKERLEKKTPGKSKK